MPLTVEQENRLAELEGRLQNAGGETPSDANASKPPTFGLDPQKQQRFLELEKRAGTQRVPIQIGELTGTAPFTQSKRPGPFFDAKGHSQQISNLIFQYPGNKLSPEMIAKSEQPPLPKIPGSRALKFSLQQQHKKQQEISEQLSNMGLRDLDIDNLLFLKNAQKEHMKGVGSAIGSTAAALTLGQIPPLTLSPVEETTALANLAKVVGRSLIAGAGGATGQTIQDAIDPDTDISFKSSFGSGAEEAIFEFLTFGGAWGAKKLFGKQKLLGPDQLENLRSSLRKAVEENGFTNVDFLPRQVSENASSELVSQLLETSLGTKSTIRKSQNIARQSLGKAVEKLPDTLAASAALVGPAQSAALMELSVKYRQKIWSDISSKIYHAAGTLIGDEPIKLSRSQEIAEFFTSIAEDAGTVTKKQYKDLARKVADDVHWEVASETRTSLSKLTRATGLKVANYDAAAAAKAQQLLKALDDDIMRTAKKIPGAAETIIAAKKHHAIGANVFYDNLTRNLLINGKRDPAVALSFIKKGNPARIALAKDALGKQGFDQLRRSWLQGLILKSGKASPHLAKGTETTAVSLIESFNGVGDDVLKAMWSPKEITTVRNNLRALDIVQEMRGVGPGSIVFNSVQLMSLAGIVPSVFNIGPESMQKAGLALPAVVLAGPSVLALMIKTKGFGRLMTEGVQAVPGTREAFAVMGRYAKLVLKSRRQVNKEKKQFQKEIERRFRMLESGGARNISPQELRGSSSRGR